MQPLSLFAAQKLFMKLTVEDALSQRISDVSATLDNYLPIISSDQVVLSSAPADMADRNLQSTYPRVCIYSNGLKNNQLEKFRAFSGEIGLVVEIWTSSDLADQVDQWIHFYVEAVAEILQSNIGDWGDGMFYPGSYDVQFYAPKSGGLGFVEAAKLTLNVHASLEWSQ